VGNSVLCHFAKVIRQTIRRLDTPCRLGGDEFAIILPTTNLEQGTALTKRLQSLIQRSPFETENICIRVRASMGIGIYEATADQFSEKKFVEDVDRLLYLSKRKERGREFTVQRSTAKGEFPF
ncbi:MAG: GGDEF domain-containing protein, partial [Aestuariivita sp.]|nr:GGDEF domain-containing protein [Aestuariivita sp.]